MIDKFVLAFAELESSKRASEALRKGSHRALGGLWGSSSALLLSGLQRASSGSFLVVTASDEDSADLEADLLSFGASGVLRLVKQDFDSDGLAESESLGARTRCLLDAAASERYLLVASLQALLQPVPAVKELNAGRLSLSSGQRIDREELLQKCQDAGLRKVPLVLGPGEVSLRGDVLDVHTLSAEVATRLEFFDDEIESIRSFDPASQASTGTHASVGLALGGHIDDPGSSSSVLEHVFRKELTVAWFEPLRIDEAKRSLVSFDKQMQTRLVALQETLSPLAWLEMGALPSHDLDFKILSAGSAVGAGESDPLGRLRSIRGMRGGVCIVCRTEAERDRLREILAHKGVDPEHEQISLAVGALHRGFRVPDLSQTFISNVEFAGLPAPSRVKKKIVVPSKAIASFFELGPGDLVVHAVHGIALFEGMERVERGDSIEDHLRLCFRDDLRLLVPVSKIHLVQKYVGAGQARPKLDKLGGKGFARRKLEVEQALYDLSAELLEVQARREKSKREPYARDSMEEDFLDGFPFEDTEDQKECWTEIRGDLEKQYPMDRLLCGDVGFGKTELAMRAAFKVAITGKQVAVLVPTTVLAEQHGQTFTERFAPLGLRVEVLSRFRKGKTKTEILDKLAKGLVDVLIGTQRILSEDVEFAGLSMLIVDEEQRFGVRQKEQLKRLRVAIDVLSLSATPIPRTLHSSLLGIRSISTLRSPPAGRQDVETHIAMWEDRLVMEAIEHELAREGQVFVLHNRIGGLEPLRKRLEHLVPKARIVTGHGQMTSAQMEKTLREFLRGDADVLLCTTIIENGLDLPRANTILIDRADCFGLSELHQLRGRVGRSSLQAYCYLLMDRNHPPGEEAKKRLKALEEFTSLGAGFAIAMKDLEIRGAGNLLGPQQSGHIAAIGYEMYCQLLNKAVDQAKQGSVPDLEPREVDVDLQIRAFLPDEFLGDSKSRLELLREMDEAVDLESATSIRASIEDRFGRLPATVENLLGVFLVKNLLTQQGVLGLQRTGPERLVVRHPADRPLGGAWLESFAETRQVEAGKTHLILPPLRRSRGKGWTAEQVLRHLLISLSGGAESPMISTWWNRPIGRQGRSPQS
ncbi:MAG: transcription-repair coupling factor [Planctomycetota bacterium]